MGKVIVAGVAGAVLLAAGSAVGYMNWHESKVRQQEAVCKTLQPYFAADVYPIKEMFAADDLHQDEINGGVSNELADNERAETQRQAVQDQKWDRDQNAEVPYRNTFLAVRKRMMERYTEFPHVTVARDERELEAKRLAAIMGYAICMDL